MKNLTPDKKSILEAYMEGVLEWNEKVNLTNITDPEEFRVKHIMDSLMCVDFKEYEEARIDEDTKNMTYAMYYLMGIGLHEQFGFGGQRCLRLFNWIDQELGTWRAGEINTAGLRKKLYDAIGIDVVLEGRKHDE